MVLMIALVRPPFLREFDETGLLAADYRLTVFPVPVSARDSVPAPFCLLLLLEFQLFLPAQYLLLLPAPARVSVVPACAVFVFAPVPARVSTVPAVACTACSFSCSLLLQFMFFSCSCSWSSVSAVPFPRLVVSGSSCFPSCIWFYPGFTRHSESAADLVVILPSIPASSPCSTLLFPAHGLIGFVLLVPI